MPYTKPLPIIVVCVVILNKNKEILLGKRKIPNPEDGLYGFPGGKVEYGETLIAACRREVSEETSMTVITDGQFLGFIEAMITGVGHYLEMFYVVTNFIGVPLNMEENKCYGWQWFPLHDLPNSKTVGLMEFEQKLLPKLKKDLELQ